MKENHLFLKVIILFIFLFLFSATSFALIPGDFGSAGGGPPDGCIDFEDLMIFAMAYGSCVGDGNWIIICDIYPDGCIDFEDLMIFAMHYGECDLVENVIAITVIYNADSHWIYVHWSTYNEASGYKIYRKVNDGNFTEVFDGYPAPSSNWPNWQGHGWYDYDVQDGNTYSYYVIANGSGWETKPSDISTRYTWLPPCSLNSPVNEAIINILEPTFSWNPVGLETSAFPYGDVAYGKTNIRVWDETAGGEQVWWYSSDGMITSSATYNCNGNAAPLVPGHSYIWQTLSHGYNEENQMIASSDSEWYEFIYVGDASAVISEVNAITELGNSSAPYSTTMDFLTDINSTASFYQLNNVKLNKSKGVWRGIEIRWKAYLAASDCGYKVYKSTNGGGFTEVFSQLAPSGYDWYGWWDEYVEEGNPYSYYVTAYGDGWETEPSETVTREVWLPMTYLESPVDGTNVNESEITFTWLPAGISSYPYQEDIVSGHTILRIFDPDAPDPSEPLITFICEDLATSEYICTDTTGLANQAYEWNVISHGVDQEGELIAVSVAGKWGFTYGMQTNIEIVNTATFSCDNQNAVIAENTVILTQ